MLHVAPMVPVVELEHLALAVDEVLAVLLWVQLLAVSVENRAECEELPTSRCEYVERAHTFRRPKYRATRAAASPVELQSEQRQE